MDADSQRWHPITPSEYAHERAALEHVRELLLDTPAVLHMIEIKSLRGRMYNRNGT
ncbi:hypothetical protein [Actinopolyspora mortivallis]|uniref:hypothetical protein n=1 Tax=Actinopolyspora mortivallis TaxID=33906 RepID=UPI0015E6211D|nr:hypothetical protein [Actinopolyspora mortivallis]